MAKNIRIYVKIAVLLGGLEHECYFSHHIGNNLIIPTDFQSIIFQRGRAQTTNQNIINHHYVTI